MPDSPLPVEAALPELRAALAAGHGVLVSPPGSGKTTRVPLALLDEPWLAGRKILMLEPRRPAVRMAAGYMARQLGEAPGETVGYAMRMERRIGPDTRIEVLTEGLFIRRLQEDPELTGVGLVIFDEYHERSLAADLGLALSQEIVRNLRDDLRLLVMSATLAGESLAGHLGARLVEADGGLHPVEIRHLERADPEVLGATARLVRRALAEQAGDVLVFLPGRAEMERLRERLADLPAEVLLLYGEQDAAAQARVLEPPPDHPRRVVLATDVAETSLTIEGIGAVVDSGLARKPRYHPGTGLTRLEVQPIARASADQRAGRAGRLGPGLCLRAYTRADYQARPAQRPPEILHQDLAGLALELALWGEREPQALPWIDPPPAPALDQARELLQRLGAIDRQGLITAHGRRMARLGLHPRLAHLLLRGGKGAAAVAALLTERDPWRRDDGPAPADLGLRLQALEDLRRGRAIHPDCDRRRLAWIDRVARRLEKQIDQPEAEETDAAALVALGWPERIARLRPGGRGRYRLAGGQGAWLPADDSLAGSEWLAVAAIQGGAREGRIQLALPIEPATLTRLFADRIRVEEGHAWEGERGRVVCRRRRLLGALVLEERELPVDGGEATLAQLMTGLRQTGLEALNWSDQARRLQARVALAAGLAPELNWPPMDDAWLAAHPEQWLAPHALGMRSLDELARLDLAKVLAQRLDWEQRQWLDEWLPERWRLADGSTAAIDYTASPPVLAAPVQAFYGLTETPTLAGGRVPLRLHLLSPAGRPVQITEDLAAFWQGAWPEVRKELRGRYPKHHWPEDPATAPAVKLKRQLDG